MTKEQTSEPTTYESVVGHCADSRSTGGQREEAGRGEVSNGKIAFSGSTLSRISDTVATNTDIHLIDGEGRHETQLTHTRQFEENPVWSPDGKKIAYSTGDYGKLYVINTDGSGQRRLTNTPGPSFVASPTWSPDSEKIAYSCPFESQIRSHTDLCVINADGTGMKRIASKVAPDGSEVATSWARE